jgi:hypothetical protein
MKVPELITVEQHTLLLPSWKIFAADFVVLFQLSSFCLFDRIQSSMQLLCECHNNTIQLQGFYD